MLYHFTPNTESVQSFSCSPFSTECCQFLLE